MADVAVSSDDLGPFQPASPSLATLKAHLASFGVERSEHAIAHAVKRFGNDTEGAMDFLLQLHEEDQKAIDLTEENRDWIESKAPAAPATRAASIALTEEQQLKIALAESLMEHELVLKRTQSEEKAHAKAVLDSAYHEAKNAAAASSTSAVAAASSSSVVAASAPAPSPSPDLDGDSVMEGADDDANASSLFRQDSGGADLGDWGDGDGEGDEMGGLPDSKPSLEPQWSQQSNDENDELMGAPAKKLPERTTVGGKQQEERKQFRLDLAGVKSCMHQDDVDAWSVTFFFDVARLSPELLYAMSLRNDDTIQITLDVSFGYRTPDAPLPKVHIEDAGGVKEALEHAIHTWMKIMWRLPAIDSQTGEVFNFLESFADFVADRIRKITQFCPLCGTRHVDGGGLKLIACKSKMCKYQFEELGLGCNPEFEVLTNPEGVDALISMTYIACTSPRKADVLVPFPESFVHLQAVNRPQTVQTVIDGQQAAAAAAAASSPSKAYVPPPQAVYQYARGAGASPLDSILHVDLEASGAAVATRDYDLVIEILNQIPSVDALKEMLLHPELARAMKESRQASAAAAASSSSSSSATSPNHPTLPREKKVTLRSILQDCHPQAFYLLRWILFTNRSYIRAVPLSEVRAHIAPLVVPDTVKQCFQFVSLPPEKEAAFRRKVQQKGESNSKWVFHGASPEVFHSIVRNSLRVLSNTRLMTAGAALGAGVYFGKTFEVSLGYTASRGGASSWPNSRENTILKTTAAGARPAQHYGYNTNLLSMMLICEIALNDLCKDHPSCYVHQDEDAITTRYLLRF